jgi:FtsP/CotA-like multicopper oxidase with cupredoxin domain
MIDLDRRQFLRSAGAASAWLATLPHLSLAQAAQRQTSSPAASPDFIPDLDIELAATPGEAAIFPGAPTQVWQFRGRVLTGASTGFEMLPGGMLPIIRVRRGQKLRVRFINDLPEESIVHWHGLHVPESMDGHPRHAIGPGQHFVYEFKVDNRAGTYWFHPHPHGHTGAQVYGGLAGLFQVSDDEERAAGLPAGEFDIAWVIQDRVFNNANQLVYLQNMMQRMNGFMGNRVLVNGQLDFTQSVATTAYRVRLLNGSNARIYRLARDDGRPLTVIGNDGGLLERPLERPFVTLAPAERVELWLNFSDRSVGDRLTLRSLPFRAGGGADSDEFPVLRVRVDRKTTKRHALPARLSTITAYRPEDAVNYAAPRRFHLQMGMGRATINGRSFEMMTAAPHETVRLGTQEIWEFANDGGMMTMPHPLHVHNLQFQVLARRRDPRIVSAGGDLAAGSIDAGWKDVVLVMPGELVRVMMRFSDHTGLYLYHCHILEHEDMGMMRNYRVVA